MQGLDYLVEHGDVMGRGRQEFGIVRSWARVGVLDLGEDSYSADPSCWGERKVVGVREYSEGEE